MYKTIFSFVLGLNELVIEKDKNIFRNNPRNLFLYRRRLNTSPPLESYPICGKIVG